MIFFVIFCFVLGLLVFFFGGGVFFGFFIILFLFCSVRTSPRKMSNSQHIPTHAEKKGLLVDSS